MGAGGRISSIAAVERTLLTTGVIDEVMQSRVDGGRRRLTPHLSTDTFRYETCEWDNAALPAVLYACSLGALSLRLMYAGCGEFTTWFERRG